MVNISALDSAVINSNGLVFTHNIYTTSERWAGINSYPRIASNIEDLIGNIWSNGFHDIMFSFDCQMTGQWRNFQQLITEVYHSTGYAGINTRYGYVNAIDKPETSHYNDVIQTKPSSYPGVTRIGTMISARNKAHGMIYTDSWEVLGTCIYAYSHVISNKSQVDAVASTSDLDRSPTRTKITWDFLRRATKEKWLTGTLNRISVGVNSSITAVYNSIIDIHL